MTLQLDPAYKRQLNDNLWNEKGRLSPEQQKYHFSEHTFRTNPQKIELIEMVDRQQKRQLKME